MTACDWPECSEPTAGAMRFCREHGHAILLDGRTIGDGQSDEARPTEPDPIVAD